MFGSLERDRRRDRMSVTQHRAIILMIAYSESSFLTPTILMNMENGHSQTRRKIHVGGNK